MHSPEVLQSSKKGFGGWGSHQQPPWLGLRGETETGGTRTHKNQRFGVKEWWMIVQEARDVGKRV